MAWCRKGDKPLSKPMMSRSTDAALGGDELKKSDFGNRVVGPIFWIPSWVTDWTSRLCIIYKSRVLLRTVHHSWELTSTMIGLEWREHWISGDWVGFNGAQFVPMTGLERSGCDFTTEWDGLQCSRICSVLWICFVSLNAPKSEVLL